MVEKQWVSCRSESRATVLWTHSVRDPSEKPLSYHCVRPTDECTFLRIWVCTNCDATKRTDSPRTQTNQWQWTTRTVLCIISGVIGGRGYSEDVVLPLQRCSESIYYNTDAWKVYEKCFLRTTHQSPILFHLQTRPNHTSV